jgi:response regulator RpfG family c-di-GMP phosphodiesterase
MYSKHEIRKPDSSPDSESVDPAARKRVLIVDDEFDIVNILRQGVINAGYEGLGACSGEEALDILKNIQVDVLVSDIQMPGMNGLELVGRVKALYDIDVIVMTGFTADFTYENIIARGAADFVQKPVSLREFNARVKRVLVERSTRIERNHATLALKENLEKFQRAMEGIIQAIAATVEMRDPYTAGHQARVAGIACAIGQAMGLAEDRVYGLRMAAVLHDVGKIAVPAEILSRPGQLTALEYGIIKNHPQYGYDILKKIEFPWPLATIVLQHHERMNGSGYPQGLKGDEIILEARILAVSDVLETIASHRPYRPSLGINHAIFELRQNRGILYDEEVVDSSIEMISSGRLRIEDLPAQGMRMDPPWKRASV